MTHHRPDSGRTALSVLIVLVLTLACGRTPPAPTPPLEPRDVVVEGTISDTAQRPVAEARVDFHTQPVVTAAADASGRYSATLHLTPGHPFDVSATQDGYAVERRTLTAPYQGTRLSVASLVLRPLQLLPLAGDYTMTLAASANCRDLPAEARQRTYTARLAPTGAGGTTFTVNLTGGAFVGPPGAGLVATARDFARVSLFVGVALDDYEIVEQVGETHVYIYGSAGLQITSDQTTATAPFNGSMGYCAAPSPGSAFPPTCAVPAVRCVATDHQLTMTQQPANH